MTTLLKHKTDNASQESRPLDYALVNSYWNNVRPSILGPYMMDGFGFPASAGKFRFRAEAKIVQRLTRLVNKESVVLDLGCGMGYWTEYFARHFRRVVAVEASAPLYKAMEQRCSVYGNVSPIHGDVMSFEPEGLYSMVFLGGMLMYLNKSDIVSLLRKLIPFLEPGGVILCRESTVQKGIVPRRDGGYHVIYRSVEAYTHIFNKCGLSVTQVEMNAPYILLQMGCEAIKKWKMNVPKRLQAIPVAGHLAYWGLRLGYPWIMRIPERCRVTFPKLTNHFFLLQAGDPELSKNYTNTADH